MKEVTPVDTSKPPVKTGLMRMSFRVVLGQEATAIRRIERVGIYRRKSGRRYRQNRFGKANLKYGYRVQWMYLGERTAVPPSPMAR